ncbi:MAG: helix-turn-helix domain-containing protein [Geminicoccaceae bacterium]|nr:MAG: helix-turn-helix domain-containing protein [Geminicoccaceae bacterium]
MAPEPLLRQIGTHLRQAREEQGLDVRDVAEFLRIRAAYLHDLEDGELAKIPGRAYALGFLRSYADYLGFDGEAIVDEVKRAGELLPQNPRLQYREPLPESHRPPLILAGVSVLLAAGVYVGWQTWQERAGAPALAPEVAITAPGSAPVRTGADNSIADPASAPEAPVAGVLAALDLPELPPVPTAPAPSDAFAFDDEAALGDNADGDADTLLSALLDDGPAPEAAGTDGVDQPAEAAAEGAAPAPARDAETLMAVITAQAGGVTPRPMGDQAGRGRVVLVASAPSWVQVRSADRAYVWTRTMEPGDAYFVPDRSDLALWTGNAGGLHVIVDGEVMRPLGGAGQVRRDIPLEADRLHSQFAQN